MHGLAQLLPSRKRKRQSRERIAMELADTAVYAVGDVHGCLDELLRLEEMIAADGAALPSPKLIVMLGDYVDRGPSSSQVLEHLLAPPPEGFERICLAGNHELAMLDYLEGRIGLSDWLRMGAAPTLISYGIDHERLRAIHGTGIGADRTIRNTIPAGHVALLRSLPVMVTLSRFVFVHAGIRPELDLDRQSDADLVSIRDDFYRRGHLLGNYVVHGHTPVTRATRYGARINIDTGAYYSGRLTALRVWRGRGRYLTT
ncbi:MAG: serine/threonine protein phosphatase [Rhizobiales bacterium 65-79]|jgi:serine/threonine protein phosphatase 1|nr:serine/threonine protein phosphatase [Hyphomicrobiales bacterium]OJU01134.1 MAG: serine/threonine protein phosphatase [Rhizobiales bacterium 65-79]